MFSIFGKILKVVFSIGSAIPIVSDLWYKIKKDVPRVTCPVCHGIKTIDTPHPQTKETVKIICPRCGGTGELRETDLREDEKKTLGLL
ncbi:MAG: hypothetical protein WBM07_17110 [Chitinivibrionales bacterium]